MLCDLAGEGSPDGGAWCHGGASWIAADRCGVQRDGLDQPGREGQRGVTRRARGGCWWPRDWSARPGSPRGKAAAKRRFLELVASGWSVSRAAREVGVNERTGRDWRDGVRKVGRHADPSRRHGRGLSTGSRYIASVTPFLAVTRRGDQYPVFVLQDRLTIADGLLSGQTMTRIAAGSASTNRRCRGRSGPQRRRAVSAVSGGSDRRGGPRPAEGVQTGDKPGLREAVEEDCRGGYRRSRSPIGLSRTSRTMKACG